MNGRDIQAGDIVRLIVIPDCPNPGVFASAVGKLFRVKQTDEYGHLELAVTEPYGDTPDSFWIEVDEVELVENGTQTI